MVSGSKLILSAIGIPVIFFGAGCGKRESTTSVGQTVAASGSSGAAPAARRQPGSFTIKELSSVREEGGERKTWLASATDQGRTVTFRVELMLANRRGDSPFTFSKGAILRQDSGASDWFLREVAKVLLASDKPPKVKPIDRLDMDVAILGTGLSMISMPDGSPGGLLICPHLLVQSL
jgi:hypothetical protein